MHKFDYTEELLQTRLIEGTKKRQESHETLAHTKIEKIKKDKNEII